MNKRNYQNELDNIIKSYEEAGIRPSLLVHSCCAPCSSYVMEYLTKYFELTMYFYNPNMNSREEYYKRADELKRLIAEMKKCGQIDCIIEDYDPESFEEIAAGHELDPERGARCHLCYRLRLKKTAEFMKNWNDEYPDKRFDFFATTLTLSPLKDAVVLNSIAKELSEQYNEKCLETDFKKKGGYQRSIELSKEFGLYRQNYCGCRFSKSEAAYREQGGVNNE
ncbi:MAG: epoxyqueuosine reductase QueH [Lachnospiraceae bacterium]|nr:epoxyqueuosine reductase QueH [Lachnospiraceae bacterium]